MNESYQHMAFKRLWLICLFLAINTIASAQREVIELPIAEGKKLLVRVTKPLGFSENKTYPVLIAPGLDGGNLKEGCRYFGPDAEQYGWILVESLVHMKERTAVKVLLDYIETHYPIKGFYILGFSANSLDAFQIAERYPDRFYGAIGIPGNPTALSEEKKATYSNTKVVMIVGERDAHWKNRAMRAKEKMDNMEIWNELIVVPNGGHILDEFAGTPLFKALNKLLAE